MSSLENILVIGLGPVGAIYACVIQSSGMANVTVVARSNYAHVKENGIHIKSQKFGEHKAWKPHRICKTVSEAADQQYSYVVVTTKCVPEVIETADLLEPLLALPVQPAYLLLQNGFTIEHGLYEALIARNQTPRIISAALHIFANQIDDFIDHDDFEKLIIGIYRPNDYTTLTNSETELATLSGLTNILVKGGSTTLRVPEIQRHKFHKNMLNVVTNGICLLTGYPLTAIFRPPPCGSQSYSPFVHPKTLDLINEYTVPLFNDMMGELFSLANAMGFPNSNEGVSEDLVRRAMAAAQVNFSKPTNNKKLTTLIDAEKGIPMEIEVIWGSVVKLATQFGVEMPRIRMAYGLMVVKQNQLLRMRESPFQAQ